MNKARILIIDDDPTIQTLFSALLTQQGYEADVASNGEEAIEKSEAKFYNLALIDIRLPDMKGTELLSKLKSATPKMRKIIITGYPDLQNAIASIQKGANYYLVKPVNSEELVDVLHNQLLEQREEENYSEKKVCEFVETRLKQNSI